MLFGCFPSYDLATLHRQSLKKMPIYDRNISTDKNVPINVPIKSFNERQRWFLILLRRKNKARAEDIVAHFDVSLKTAKRDIEGLKDVGKIRFVGARKTGRYEVVQS
jgi:predicted HTH transcriptional regulator